MALAFLCSKLITTHYQTPKEGKYNLKPGKELTDYNISPWIHNDRIVNYKNLVTLYVF